MTFNRLIRQLFLVLSGFLCVCSAGAQTQQDFDQCVLELVGNAAPEVTVAEIRETCRAAHEPLQTEPVIPEPEVTASAIDRRLAMEGATQVVPFVITPHKPNYIITSYNFDDYEESLFEEQFNEDVSFKNAEVDFQVSFKFPVVRNLFTRRANMYVAYTNRSFWQLFADNDSSPFRETNHEPEVWLSLINNWDVLGLKNRLINVGLNHQSNGRGGVLSRSWNRVYANFVFERNNFYFGVKPWYRLQEDSDEDDNSDIEDYMGYFEFQGVYNRNKNNIGLFFRNQLKDDYRGAVQLDWSFPLYNQARGYVQYFYGYGESLIDYDNKVNKLGVGIKLSDWL